ncbi:uncharacterized protein LOC131887330 [Tigriopus californicus]|uniref:uncharacterized protein LOC131887330 n=1 Tax=Tigriopus californicus TaxID=6832 RepID=UPI0027DA0AA6|nr:uncharacterized protein LOC131887330 [Tigriopus californicus]
MEPNRTYLRTALALTFISFSQGQIIKHARYESELAPPSRWPGYFFGSSSLIGDQGGQNFVCGVRCQLSDVGCGMFLVKDNICYMGSRTNRLPSVIVGPQTSDENVFVNPEHIDDLIPLFNSISGAQSSIEWLSTIDSYIDLPPESVLNHCLYHCLYEELVCDIAVFENGRCHFGQLDGPKNATASQLIDPAGPWDLFFSPPYRTWYFGNNTWHSAFNSVGPRLSKHLFRLLFGSIEEMCAIDCNFHTQYSSPCSFYAYNNETQECYLGALNYTGNMFGEIIWQNVTVKAMTGKFEGYYS